MLLNCLVKEVWQNVTCVLVHPHCCSFEASTLLSPFAEGAVESNCVAAVVVESVAIVVIESVDSVDSVVSVVSVVVEWASVSAPQSRAGAAAVGRAHFQTFCTPSPPK